MKDYDEVKATEESFRKAIEICIEKIQDETAQELVIYYEDGSFGACNKACLSGNEIVWEYDVNEATFGDFEDFEDIDDIVEGFVDNCFMQAIHDLEDYEKHVTFAEDKCRFNDDLKNY